MHAIPTSGDTLTFLRQNRTDSLPFEPDAELLQTIREPVGTIGRLARLKHADGTQTRNFI